MLKYIVPVFKVSFKLATSIARERVEKRSLRLFNISNKSRPAAGDVGKRLTL